MTGKRDSDATPSNPMDCSLPGSSIHGIFQARVLEWGASPVQLLVTPRTIAHESPLFMGFSRQEYWSGLPFPSPGDLPDPRIEPQPPELAGGFFTVVPPEKPATKEATSIRSSHVPTREKLKQQQRPSTAKNE